MKETISVDGVDLDELIVTEGLVTTAAQGVEGTSGLFTVPAKRGSDVRIPRRHGALYVAEKRYEPTDLVLVMWVRGVDAQGCVPDDPSARRAFYARVRALTKLFTAGDRVTLRLTLSDATAREITVEVIEALNYAISGAGGRTRGRVSIGLTAADPFWTDLTTTAHVATLVSGATSELTDFAAASADMDDTLVTFYPGSNPVLAQPSTGQFLAYDGIIPTGRKIIVDTALWTVTGTVDTGGTWEPASAPTQHIRRIRHRRDQPRLFTLRPQHPAPVISLTHTGAGVMTVALTARQRHKLP